MPCFDSPCFFVGLPPPPMLVQMLAASACIGNDFGFRIISSSHPPPPPPLRTSFPATPPPTPLPQFRMQAGAASMRGGVEGEESGGWGGGGGNYNRFPILARPRGKKCIGTWGRPIHKRVRGMGGGCGSRHGTFDRHTHILVGGEAMGR